MFVLNVVYRKSVAVSAKLLSSSAKAEVVVGVRAIGLDDMRSTDSIGTKHKCRVTSAHTNSLNCIDYDSDGACQRACLGAVFRRDFKLIFILYAVSFVCAE